MSAIDKLVAAFERDISDRRGLRHEWDRIDADVKAEIRAKWRDIIATHLNTGEPPCTCSYEDSEEMTSHAPLCAVSKVAEANEWKAVAQEFVNLFDPLAKPGVSSASFRAVMQGVKNANASLREGLPQTKVVQLREELAMALSRLPDDEALTKFLDNAHHESEVSDLDNVEAGMELQDSLAVVRDALNVAMTLLPVAVVSKDIAPVSKPLKPGWKGEVSTETKPKTTVHVLRGGLPLCKFTDKLPRDWPDDQKWAHSVEELKRLRDPEVPCMECVRQEHLKKSRVP